jgi:hypothetical protein
MSVRENFLKLFTGPADEFHYYVFENGEAKEVKPEVAIPPLQSKLTAVEVSKTNNVQAQNMVPRS